MTKSALSKLILIAVLVLTAFGCVPRGSANYYLCPSTRIGVAPRPPAAPKPSLTTLANGIRLVLVPMPDSKVVTLQVMYGVGERDDVIPGTAHFLEHLLFKGTARRPDSADLRRLLDNLGAEFNGGTSSERTEYHVTLESGQLASAMDILHDMLTGSLVRESDVDLDRHAIIVEEHIYSEDTSRLSRSNLMSLMYTTDGLGYSGPTIVKGLRRLTGYDLLAFHRRHYVPANMVVTVAGKLDEAEAKALVNGTFGTMPATAWELPATDAPAFGDGPRLTVVKHPGASKVSLNLGFPGLSDKADGKVSMAMDMMAAVLGGSTSSRLFTEVRGGFGAAYGLHAASYNLSDTGQFIVWGNLDADLFGQALTVIIRELKRLKDEPVSDEELFRATERVRVSGLSNHKTSEQEAAYYGSAVINHNSLPVPGAYAKAVRKVTPAQIQEVAREFLRASRLYLSAVAPPGTNVDYEAIIRQLGE